ncbi:hypothetical protein [Falsiroseomonas ponticola]|uniref:hypothetical protein n=1 Tax=Falsiroseomonas ponticola TaxID=2786951 RepID=UPI0019339CB5|nr:hypothetical protein [Roseomonas ponticola]
MLLGPAILAGRKWQEATARMEFGTRSIRSAGQGSGSVEVTLPPAFRGLAGLPCRVALRDGLRPELVLQPELAGARAAFGHLWALLSDALDLGAQAVPLAECAITLWPAAEAPGAMPRLAWADGLALAGRPPHEAAALARSLAALAQIAAGRRGIGAALSQDFGAACAQALGGIVIHPAMQSACDIGAALLAAGGLGQDPVLALAAGDARGDAFRDAALPRLRLLAEQHLDWTDDPARHASLLVAWRRGVALELSGA